MDKPVLQKKLSKLTAALRMMMPVFVFIPAMVLASPKTTVISGNYNDPAVWSPSGVPINGDEVMVQSGHTLTIDGQANVSSLIIQSGGSVLITSGKKLTIQNSLTVNGTLSVDEGDVALTTQGGRFTMGPNSELKWNPGDNTVNGASLFINGDEDFHSTSTLSILKWYNYSQTPIGSVVSGNFGNLTLSTIENGLIFEWNQNNTFETHKVLGTLTVNQGWIVLDKSGSIKNTYIGKIELKNANSYLDFHNGDHPDEFTVTANQILNTGGTLNGITNGNGNIHLVVNSNFTNLGNTCLIYNGGVSNKGNGNAYLKIAGKYQQSHGDFRGIFNISSAGAGVTDIEINDAEITGGIFMAQYACHPSGKVSKLTIHNDLLINFTNNSDKFRGNGLTSLSGNSNTSGMEFLIEGKLIIGGNGAAEFISSGSNGIEQFHVRGDAFFNNSNIFFNCGDHTTELYFEKSLHINGGNTVLSKTTGALTSTIQQNLEVTNGILNIRNKSGIGSMIIQGAYNQSGGFVNFYNNEIDPAQSIVYTTVHGNFLMTSGTISFDNNSSSTVNHKLALNGTSFKVNGNSSITSAGTLDNPVFGIIYFDHTGEMTYNNTGSTTGIKNVKQVIGSGCELKLVSGDMMAAGVNTSEQDMIKVSSGGILDVDIYRIKSNGQGLGSSIYIDEDGRLRLPTTAGLYDGTSNSAINAEHNMTYSLHENSVVEYYGADKQVITGTGLGTAQTQEQQYGILEINKKRSSAELKASNVVIRTGLHLNEGELNLNNFNLTIKNGKQFAITTTDGYIRSESSKPGLSGKVIWKNISTGEHIIPFGISQTKLLPFSFLPVSGTGLDFSVSTCGTREDNRPLPSGVTNLNIDGRDEGVNKMIDRWYYVYAPGVIADITCSYLPGENTTNELYATGNFSGLLWKENKWNFIGGSGKGKTTETGMVNISYITEYGYLLLGSRALPQPADILTFNAELSGGNVNLNWTQKANIPAKIFIVERSNDGINFEQVIEKYALNITAVHNYNDIDYSPFPGESYYRLKQIDTDGTMKFSQTVTIKNGIDAPGIEILTVGPNPFKTDFTASYNVTNQCIVNIKLTSLNGQVIYEEANEAAPGINKFHYTSKMKLSPGIYLLVINDGRTTSTRKLFCM